MFWSPNQGAQFFLLCVCVVFFFVCFLFVWLFFAGGGLSWSRSSDLFTKRDPIESTKFPVIYPWGSQKYISPFTLTKSQSRKVVLHRFYWVVKSCTAQFSAIQYNRSHQYVWWSIFKVVTEIQLPWLTTRRPSKWLGWPRTWKTVKIKKEEEEEGTKKTLYIFKEKPSVWQNRNLLTQCFSNKPVI